MARLTVRNDQVADCATATRPDTGAVINWLTSGAEPLLGLGIDTLTLWSTGKSGWRPADLELRKRYKGVRNSVLPPNFLSGAMSLNGMMVMLSLRREFPDLTVSEAHPKVLYFARTRSAGISG